MFEDAIAGRAAITHSDAASYTLTTANAATDEARNMILNIGGALTAARNTVVPTASKLYVAKNATTGGFTTTLKTTAGTGIAIPNGNTTLLFCDGTNVVDAINYLSTLTIASGLTVTAGVTKVGDGLVGAPTYSFVSDPTKGFWSNASNQITLSITGSAAHSWSAGGYTIANNAGTLNIGASADVVLTRDAADVLAQRRTTNAQAFRVYNTFTDASNYERVAVQFSGNLAGVLTQQAGTGTARALQVGTSGSANIQFIVNGANPWQISAVDSAIVASTDNAVDIGRTGASRPRSFYWGTQALGPDGTVGAPSFSFSSATNYGVYYDAGASKVAISVAGAKSISFGVDTILFGSSADLSVVRDAANTLAQRNSTTAQVFRVYNTFTDASNYERGRLEWTANTFTIGTQSAGTGTQRDVRISAGASNIGTLFLDAGGNAGWALIGTSTPELRPQITNTRDIGSASFTVRTIYIGTSIVMSAAASKIIPGATSLSLRNNADSADNLLISDAGAVTVRGNIIIGGASMVQNSQSAAYTTVAADANKHILHPTADNNARTFTIDSNANVAYTIGTCITFVNQINVVTIAITSDTLTLAGAGTTGSRTLAANGIATAIKVEATKWVISGTGLS